MADPSPKHLSILRSVGHVKLLARLQKYISVSLDGCWNWTGKNVNHGGYGRTMLRGKKVLAHRISYFLAHDCLPLNGELDHLCRNRLCVNPKHLELVSRRMNLLRGNSPVGISSRKTNCNNGHPLIQRPGSPQRHCQICVTTQQRERRARLRELGIKREHTERRTTSSDVGL